MAVLLTAKDIVVEFPAKKILDGVTLGVHEGNRIGIVGKNGDGKSSLLAVLAGQHQPDSGDVILKGNPSIGLLGQDDSLNDSLTVGEAVVGTMPEYLWASDRKTREIIDALLSDLSWTELLRELSGGQRRRVDLARLLIKSWDVLMLDEPTNHLDMHAIAWLAEHLKSRWQKGAGALLVVTHDRWFLDEVALSMWEVHDGTVEPFEGGFSAYVQQRVERDRVAQTTEEKRRNLMRKELAWLSRGAQARSSKPKFHLKAARELIAEDPPIRNSLELKHMAMTRLGKQAIEFVHVVERLGESTILNDLDWLIGPGDRYGILGENGAGKTTLLKLIAGKILPTSGEVKIGKTVKMAMLSQRLEELREVKNDRVREVLSYHKGRLMVDGKNVTTAQLLERLGFEREHMQSYVRDLSGGQKRRLQLLLTLADEPNVLILDEPGNDMDTDMLAVMEDLLDSWPGTLLLVSHDRYLMERVTDDQFALIDGKIRHMTGGVDEYLSLLDKSQPKGASLPNKAATRNETQKETGAESLPEGRLKTKLSGGAAHQAKKQLAATERKLANLEQRLQELNAEMQTAEPTDYLVLGNLEAQTQELKNQIAELEEQWILLVEQLEL